MASKRMKGRASRSPSHKRYNAEERWRRNKKRRVSRHCRKFPNDKQAQRILSKL